MSSLLSETSYLSTLKIVYNETLMYMEMLVVEWVEKLDVHVAINKQCSALKRPPKVTSFN